MHKKALVRDLLKEKQTELTAAERKLSAVLLDDQLLTGLQSITRLAELAEVSSPTIIRLARKLGFDGFSDMQDAIRDEIGARMKKPLAKLDTPWARDLLDQLYLDDDTQAWADNVAAVTAHKDAHGAPLQAGDTVVLIKDLPVKGAGFTAKRGTAVRGIALVPDNAAHIEGRVEGQRIVILTEFVKRK
mgnify:CR=1 FL=1